MGALRTAPIECGECKKPYSPEELKEFEVPFNVSAAYDSQTLGMVRISLCEKCLKKNGEPWKAFVSRIIYRTIPRARVKVPKNPKVVTLTIDPELFEFIRRQRYPRCRNDSEVMRKIFEYFLRMEGVRKELAHEKEQKLFSRI